MNKIKRENIICYLLLIFLALIPTSTLAVEYTYTEIKPLGWGMSYVTDINNTGDIVGFGTDSQGLRKGFLYSEGSYTELLPPGWTNLSLNVDELRINDNGSVIGTAYSSPSGNRTGFLYSGGNYTEIFANGRALDINNNEVVTGYVGTFGWGSPYIYSGGNYTILDFKYPTSQYGDQNLYPSHINDNGAIAGTLTTNKGFTTGDGYYDEFLPPGFTGVTTMGLNNSNAVVGYGNTESGQKGFLYSGGTSTELLPPGWSTSQAYGINNNGQVVGASNENSMGFLYDNGTYTELSPAGWLDVLPRDINDNGIIVGGYQTGIFSYSSFMATPVVPEPISSILFITGGALLAGRRYLNRKV